MSQFRVRGELSLDGSKWSDGLARAQGQASRFASTVASSVGARLAAAFSIGAVVAISKATMRYADSIEETSTRLGVSTDALQEWQYAASQTGATVEQLTRFIERLAAAAGDSSKLDLFKRMGINPNGMNAESLFGAVSSFARKSSISDLRSALGGIVGIESLGPVVNLLQSDLNELGQTARNAGAVMDSVTLHSLATLNDQLSIIAQILYTQFGPALLSVAKVMLRIFGAAGAVVSDAGARTGGLGKKDFLRMMTGGVGGAIGIASALVKMSQDPNQATYNETADKLFSEKILAIEDMLAKLASYKAPGLSTIIPTSDKKKRTGRAPDSDSLVRVGNFLGDNGAAAKLNNLAEQQVGLQRRMVTTLEEIRNNMKDGDLGI